MIYDIVEKLRAPDIGWSGDAACIDAATAEEGAVEIERLRDVLQKAATMLKSDCSKAAIADFLSDALARDT